jgi:YHS domain-containing protein
MKNLFIILAAAFAPLLLSNNVYAQQAIRVAQFNTDKGLAIQGYDPVAYFTQNKGVKGTSAISVNAEGITYYFATPQDKELFKKDHTKYEPQYGGWCAYAMGANGEKVDVDPETFKIINGKLYLFYHTWVNNTLNKWNADQNNLMPKADASWAKFTR